MKKIFFYISFIFFLNNSLSGNEINCKKFDLKCKAKKFIEDTKDYQNKGLEESKKQIDQTKDKVLKNLPKK